MIFLHYLFSAIYYLIDLLVFLIVARALISWFPLSEENKLISFLDMMTEPVVGPIRKLLNKSETVSQLPVDFSPVVAILVLTIISGVFAALA